MKPSTAWNHLRILPWRSVLRVTRLVILPVALGFLAYLAWSLRATLGEVVSQAHFIYLLVSVLLWAGANLISPFLSVLSLSHENASLGYTMAARIHVRNILARYIPGGVWHTVGRVADFSDRGLSPRRIAGFVFLENSLAVSVTLAVGGAIVGYFYGLNGWGGIGALSAVTGVTGLILSRFIVNRWILPDGGKISLAVYARCIAVVGIFWVFAVAAFVSYLHAFPGWILPASWLQIGGAYLLAWGAGFLAVFAPQGVGVFEVVLAGLIADSMPLGAVVVMIGGFRVVTMAADVLVWLALRLVFFRDN